MLTPGHLAIIRAALLYLDEEMCPHGLAAMWPYFDTVEVPLSAGDVGELRSRFDSICVKYAIYDATRRELVHTRLFGTDEEARRQAAASEQLAVVLLPPHS